MPYFTPLVFFFQAEDGIRDYKVTGVQTCALPIYGRRRTRQDFTQLGGDLLPPERFRDEVDAGVDPAAADNRFLGIAGHVKYRQLGRSEEHTSELQSPCNLVCRLLLEKKNVDGLHAGDVQAETRLIIPMSGNRDSDSMTFSKRPTRYRVRKDDTVLSVADDFGVPPDRI